MEPDSPGFCNQLQVVLPGGRGAGIRVIFLGLLGLKLFFTPWTFVSVWIGAEIPERAYISSLVLNKGQFC